MKNYKIHIIETLEKDVTIQAKDEKEALQLVDNNYRAAKDDYILDAENFTGVKFEVVEE